MSIERRFPEQDYTDHDRIVHDARVGKAPDVSRITAFDPSLISQPAGNEKKPNLELIEGSGIKSRIARIFGIEINAPELRVLQADEGDSAEKTDQ